MSEEVTFLKSLNLALHESMRADPSIVVLGEDILDPYGGAFKVVQGLSTEFPDRVFTTPICEATIIGLAVGLAIRGKKPVAEIMFGDFLTLATDQIINHAVKYHAMYNTSVDVPIVIRTPMGGGRGYGPTHSQSLEKFFLGVPHLKVIAPSHFHNAGELLKKAISDRNPVLFIENKSLYAEKLCLKSSEFIERIETKEVESYPTIVLRNFHHPSKPDITIISYGGLSHILHPLLLELLDEEIRVLACLPGWLNQEDNELIFDCAKQTGRVIVVEDGSTPFGWGAEIATRIYNVLYKDLHCPIKRVGALHTVVPAAKSLEEEVLVSGSSIRESILETLRYGL